MGESLHGGSLTYVMLLNSDCDWEFRDQFEYLMRAETPYDQYLNKEYQVICLGGVGNFSNVADYVVPTLRMSLPADDFVFVYPSTMVLDYHDYVDENYGSQYRYSSLGNSEIPKGVAYASEVPSYVKHEMAHLHTCGTWHDENGFDLGYVTRHPEANDLSWCTN